MQESDSLTHDALSQAQVRLNDAMQAVHVKISDQQTKIQQLNDENTHLKQLLETQAESLAVLSQQKQEQAQTINDEEKQTLIREVEALRSEKKMIKERLDRTIAALEAQVMVDQPAPVDQASNEPAPTDLAPMGHEQQRLETPQQQDLGE